MKASTVAILIGFVLDYAGVNLPYRHAMANVSGHLHAHHHAHDHDGTGHHHAHSHRMPTAPNCGNACLGEGDDDDHHCCGGHHHAPDAPDDVLPSRSRDSVPTPIAIASTPDLPALCAQPTQHRQLWPYARGRPPDHLVHLQTVVLLT